MAFPLGQFYVFIISVIHKGAFNLTGAGKEGEQ
jgi:hypothetical protein